MKGSWIKYVRSTSLNSLSHFKLLFQDNVTHQVGASNYIKRALLDCAQYTPSFSLVPSSVAVLGLLIYRETTASFIQNRQQCITNEPHTLKCKPLSCTSFFVYLESHFQT
jgi:hypothetical protein